jgi:hypothetical protein
MTENKKCLNCEMPIEGNFCKNCGQSSSVSRITLKETINHFISSSFSIEGPFRKTITDLIKNPGALFRSYISGQRKTYYKPVALFVLSTALYLIIRALIGYDPLEGEMGKLDEKTNSETANTVKEAAKFMVTNINNILFVLVFSLALMFKVFFRRKYNFAEYLSVSFYVTSFYILFGILTMIFSNYTGIKTANFQLFVLIAYTFYSSFSLFQSRRFGSIIKYFTLSILSLSLYMILGFGVAFAIVYFF